MPSGQVRPIARYGPDRGAGRGAQPERLGQEAGAALPRARLVRAGGVRDVQRVHAHATSPSSSVSNGVWSVPRSTMSHSKASAQLSCGALEGEPADRPVPGRRRDGVEDRVLAEQRVVREVHLRDQPLGERPAEEAEVDVRRPPGVVVVAPRVGAGLDRQELVAAQAVGDHAAQPVEVRVQRRRAGVDDVPVAAGGVGLPHLDQGVGHRAAVAVEHPPVDEDPLAHRLAAVAQRQVGVLGLHPVLAEHRAGDLGQPVRQVDRRAQRGAQRRCSCSPGSRRACGATSSSRR